MHTSSRVTLVDASLEIEFLASDIDKAGHALFVAVASQPFGGSAQTPFSQGFEGSSVFLPFRANRLYSAHVAADGIGLCLREWKRWAWNDRIDAPTALSVCSASGQLKLHLTLDGLDRPLPSRLKVAVWAKRITANNGWGEMIADEHAGTSAGINDRLLPRYFLVDLEANSIQMQARGKIPDGGRVRIYQLLPRLFSNTNETRIPNGTIEQNGVGKFNQITGTALAEIRGMGFTHVWLTGVLTQITSTDYASIGLPADDPDLLKGLAGSPYAIRDYFDVSPDYAENPAERLREFRALLERVCAAGLRTIIDLVPNHVGRCYSSTVRPELSFGVGDDPTRFFGPHNNFFWLQPDSPGGGPPLRLPTVDEDGAYVSPTCLALSAGDGLFEGERDSGRVTGNNASTWRPGVYDWYETVKLNYGFDFTTGARDYPHAGASGTPIPDTWLKMDAVIAYWQSFRVDGFRCDMAHMVPPEFWAWALDRARQRDPSVFFVAEAYDNDPMKVGPGNVMLDLLNAGFNAVYDDPSYKALKGLYEGSNWANDLDGALAAFDREFIFQNSLRYAENHDEVRLAGRDQWRNIGPAVGRPVCAILYGVGRGPVLLYSGQEVGEPAAGAEGFGGDDARTTIFDYWSMPELAKWVNFHRYDGGALSGEQSSLRSFYSKLIQLSGEPAFRDGGFFGLNYANREEPQFGRLHGETTSGHWLYAFLRSDRITGQSFLVAVNLHPDQALSNVRIRFPREALTFIGYSADRNATLVERLSSGAGSPVRLEDVQLGDGVFIAEIPPLTPYYFELQIGPDKLRVAGQ